MFKTLNELFALLSPEQRKKFWFLQFFVILMALFELVGVASIAPFMSVVVNPGMIETNALLNSVYQSMAFNDTKSFTIFLGALVLISLTVSTLISIFTSWRLAMFGTIVGAEISQKLYGYYINENWLFHASGSSAQFTKQIANEVGRVTMGIILPAMQINSKLILIIVLSVGVFIVNPVVAFSGVVIFTLAYLIIYKLVRVRISRNGRLHSSALTRQFRLMNEGFGGIKDVLLMSRQKFFENNFKIATNDLARTRAENTSLAQVPRYMLELVAYGALILLIVILLYKNDGNSLEILPLLAVYALAGFKILPAFQTVYGNMAQIKGDMPAYESIKSNLFKAQVQQNIELNRHEINDFPFKEYLELKNIVFTYPKKHRPVLSNLSLKISKNHTIGLVGPSGSGKSTVIDILMGLIAPEQGDVLIDGKLLENSNLEAWKKKIGFVAQSIFLSEGTIAENIAFGYSMDEIDLNKINRVIELAHLDELVNGLPEGVNTKVGERGVQLSGGQRQRIGIARALYHDVELLVFDEATSALDGITEKLIMDAIHDFAGSKTIIMIAHRLKTVEKCNQIFFLDHGRVIDQGTYDQLMQTNEYFRKMAGHS